MAADNGAAARVEDGSTGSADNGITTERFVVSYEPENGYGLFTEEDLDTWISVEFANAEALEDFQRFFANENQPRYEGKTIYCDCTGRRHIRYGTTAFEISRASLFAR